MSVEPWSNFLDTTMARGMIYPAEDCPPKLGLDEACLRVFNFGGSQIKLFEQVEECYVSTCECLPWKVIPANSNASLLVNSAYPLHFYYETEGYISCHETFRFSEHKTYTYTRNISGDDCRNITPRSTFDANYWLPIVWASVILILTTLLWVGGKKAYKSQWATSFRSSALPFSNVPYENNLNIPPESNNPPVAAPVATAHRQVSRINSLDTFRGICIAMMIFVNYGGGQYLIFKHTAWNGLTFADLVFPWFLWVMGFSLVLSLRSQFRNDRSRITVWLLVTRRSIILIALGLVLNSVHGHNHLDMYRIPGVLQRIGLTYFVIASIETCFMNPGGSFQSRICEDIIYGWIQNLVAALLVLTWLIITFLVDVPDCGPGYLGPGGMEKRGRYANCTGGAAGYIDRMVFTPNHIYQHPTCEKIFRSTQPYDPEGLLGTLTAAVLVHLGAQAGRILFCYSMPNRRIVRWLVWGVASIICAGILCKFDLGSEGHIPINKNLFSLSYILLTGGAAFIILAFLYLIEDHYDCWDGAPFKYAGRNAILLYVGHELVKGMFPWFWKPIWNTHAELLGMNIWATSLWLLIAYVLWRKNLFLPV